jgi:pimeloyl-ACP methyl ester carboxylesterase
MRSQTGDASSDMDVLVLHGLGGSAAQSLEQIAPAFPAEARIIAPDVRAHGESMLIGSPSDFTLDALAAEIAATVRAHGPGPLTIIGTSMGAAIGLRLALSGEFDLERLVFVRPAFTDVPLPPNLRGFPVMGELLQRHGPVEAERRFKTSSLYHAISLVSQRMAALSLEQFRAPDAAARAVRLVEVPRNRAFRTLDELAVIDTPTTIVAAPRDPVHPVAIAELWQRGIRGARLEMLPARDGGLQRYLTALRSSTRSALEP